MPLGAVLESANKIHIHTIGNSTIRLFKARELITIGMEKVRKDPLFLVSADTKKEAEKYLPPTNR